MDKTQFISIVDYIAFYQIFPCLSLQYLFMWEDDTLLNFTVTLQPALTDEI